MERIGNLILNQTKAPPVSNQLSSANKANQKQWSKEQADMYWRNQLVISMKSISPTFTIDDSNRQLLKALYQWIWGMPGILDLDKGLLLHGSIGVGKSTLLKGLQNYAAKIARYCIGGADAGLTFQFTSAAEIALQFAEKGIAGLNQYTDRSCMHNLAIDEVGREPMDAKHFGTGINAIQTVLQLRYEQRYCFYTHMTTNLDPNTEFSGRYGDYIADRVKEMFNVVKIEGKSRR
jgi:DNA replication protein DnaC